RGIKYSLNFKKLESLRVFELLKTQCALPAAAWVDFEGQKWFLQKHFCPSKSL
ncbi:MAG: hypothetical protein ACI9JY_002590, partial [Saprospiraceae bacterium]